MRQNREQARWKDLLKGWYQRPMTISAPCGTATAQVHPTIAFIIYRLAKLDKTNCKDNTGAKDLTIVDSGLPFEINIDQGGI
jgi:hypothetical protein